VCDPSKGPTLHILICAQCGTENEAFSDEARINCESCGVEISNPHYHVHTPVKCEAET